MSGRMKFRCTACGREFDKGALIIDNVILCPDCAAKLHDIVDSCVYENVMRLINGEKIDIDGCVNEHLDDIVRLKLRPLRVKLMILRGIKAYKDLAV